MEAVLLIVGTLLVITIIYWVFRLLYEVIKFVGKSVAILLAILIGIFVGIGYGIFMLFKCVPLIFRDLYKVPKHFLNLVESTCKEFEKSNPNSFDTTENTCYTIFSSVGRTVVIVFGFLTILVLGPVYAVEFMVVYALVFLATLIFIPIIAIVVLWRTFFKGVRIDGYKSVIIDGFNNSHRKLSKGLGEVLDRSILFLKIPYKYYKKFYKFILFIEIIPLVLIYTIIVIVCLPYRGVRKMYWLIVKVTKRKTEVKILQVKSMQGKSGKQNTANMKPKKGGIIQIIGKEESGKSAFMHMMAYRNNLLNWLDNEGGIFYSKKVKEAIIFGRPIKTMKPIKPMTLLFKNKKMQIKIKEIPMVKGSWSFNNIDESRTKGLIWLVDSDEFMNDSTHSTIFPRERLNIPCSVVITKADLYRNKLMKNSGEMDNLLNKFDEVCSKSFKQYKIFISSSYDEAKGIGNLDPALNTVKWIVEGV